MRYLVIDKKDFHIYGTFDNKEEAVHCLDRLKNINKKLPIEIHTISNENYNKMLENCKRLLDK